MECNFMQLPATILVLHSFEQCTLLDGMITAKIKVLSTLEPLGAPKFDLFVEYRNQKLNNTTRNSAYVLSLHTCLWVR